MSSATAARSSSPRDRSAPTLICAWLAAACLLPSAIADGNHRPGATVLSTVSAHYRRERHPDGSPKPETYAFGNGGCTAGASRDKSIDDLGFLAVAAELVDPLARSGYVVCKQPESTQLLIMVHWGTTVGATDVESMPERDAPGRVSVGVDPPRCGSPATNPKCVGSLSPGFEREQQAASGGSMAQGFENRVRDQLVWRNARILGLTEELRECAAVSAPPGVRDRQAEVLGDLEESRYFVILVAYDFQKAWRQKQLEVLWTTRFSLRTRGNRFDDQLPAMVAHAARFFGTDSHGVIRSARPPKGSVTIGPAEVMEQE